MGLVQKNISGQTKFSYWLPSMILPHMWKSVVVWNGICFATLIPAWLAYTSEDQVSKLGIKGYSTNETAWVRWYWKVTLRMWASRTGSQSGAHTPSHLQQVSSPLHLIHVLQRIWQCGGWVGYNECGNKEGASIFLIVALLSICLCGWLCFAAARGAQGERLTEFGFK
jgi:hypothetical protein